jgi:hypothetical protein
MINTLPQSLIDTATKILKEAAVPDRMKSMTFFHGTTNREAALGIAKEGIKAPDLKNKKGDLVPVSGKVYVTPHIHYAQIYALGGDIAGSKSSHHISDKEKYGDYGYVFGVGGNKLNDIQPDEDSIGEMINKQNPAWLHSMASWHLHPTTYKKVMDGEYAKYAVAGKQLVKKMSDDQKQLLIHQGAHIAHHGTLVPDQVYRIHRDKIPLLNRDGSNFFDHAEKIDLKDI